MLLIWLAVVFSASHIVVVTAFDLLAGPSARTNVLRTTTSTTTTSFDMVNRKEALKIGMLSILGGVPTVLFPALPARADVSSGDMPDSAAQFNRIIRLKRDLKVCIVYFESSNLGRYLL
jgi:hypothetical protein